MLKDCLPIASSAAESTKCIKSKIQSCSMKSYLKNGKCIPFKFSKLKIKPKNFGAFDFTKLNQP